MTANEIAMAIVWAMIGASVALNVVAFWMMFRD